MADTLTRAKRRLRAARAAETRADSAKERAWAVWERAMRDADEAMVRAQVAAADVWRLLNPNRCGDRHYAWMCGLAPKHSGNHKGRSGTSSAEWSDAGYFGAPATPPLPEPAKEA